MFMQSLPKLKL